MQQSDKIILTKCVEQKITKKNPRIYTRPNKRHKIALQSSQAIIASIKEYWRKGWRCE